MNKQSIRAIFDQISLDVISFLDHHIGITDVDFQERQGVAEVTINKWEEENAPYVLPDDYKAFLQISDGFQLTWKIKKNDQVFPLGLMHLNKLRDIKRVSQLILIHLCNQIKSDKFKFARVGDEEATSDEEGSHSGLQEETKAKDAGQSKEIIAAYDMDSKVKDGRLALLYKNNYSKPQVWFQDLSCNWFFIANTFTDYFRLMIMHIGLPHWHYAFTQVGLDPMALQWFRFLSPERLQIDIENRKTQEALAQRKIKGDKSGMKGLANEKIKVEGIRRKKRRMKLKAKGNSESIIENFTASSSKGAKFARSKTKKEQGKDVGNKKPSTSHIAQKGEEKKEESNK